MVTRVEKYSELDAFVQGSRCFARCGEEQRDLCMEPNYRGGAEDGPSAWGQAGCSSQYRIAHRRWQPAGVRGEDLGDEEWIAAGALVHLADVEHAAGVVHEPRDAFHGQQWHLHASHTRRCSKVPHHEAQRMTRTHLVVPEGHHDQKSKVGQPATQEADEIHGCLVGPVRILDHEQRRLGRQRLTRLGEEVTAPRALLSQLVLNGTQRCSNVRQWAQRSGGATTVTEAA